MTASALDHLAWQLVIANGKKPDQNTSFPIYRDLEFRSDKAAFFTRARRAIGKCSPAAQDVIESLQPYREKGDDDYWASHHPLWMLSEIDIIDKHRLINIVGGHYKAKHQLDPSGATFMLDGMELPVTQWEESGTFEEYMIIGEIGPDGQRTSKFEPDISIGLALGQQAGIKPGTKSAVSGQTFEVLGKLLGYVRDEALPRFVQFFP